MEYICTPSITHGKQNNAYSCGRQNEFQIQFVPVQSSKSINSLSKISGKCAGKKKIYIYIIYVSLFVSGILRKQQSVFHLLANLLCNKD